MVYTTYLTKGPAPLLGPEKAICTAIVLANIQASGKVRTEGPNRVAQRTLGKMGIKNQPSAPRHPDATENNSCFVGGYLMLSKWWRTILAGFR